MSAAAVTFRPAAAFSLAQLADLYTRMFAAYAYPIVVSADWLAARLVPEDIDLAASPVICVDNEPAGLAVYARRGSSVNCAGFGIVVEQRGRGLATLLLDAFVQRARAERITEITLMVLADNAAAVQTYRRAGFVTTRRLDWFEGAITPTDTAVALVETPVTELLAGAASLGLQWAEPFWQAADVTLLRTARLRALTLLRAGRTVAAVVVQPDFAGTGLYLQRLLAVDHAAALAVLDGLARYTPKKSAHDPADAPWHAALRESGLPVLRCRFDMRQQL